jgi:hypothetical protein
VNYIDQATAACQWNLCQLLQIEDHLCGLAVRVPGYRSRGPGSILFESDCRLTSVTMLRKPFHWWSFLPVNLALCLHLSTCTLPGLVHSSYRVLGGLQQLPRQLTQALGILRLCFRPVTTQTVAGMTRMSRFLSPCLRTETYPVSETLCFLVLRNLDDGWSPETQWFWTLSILGMT